eukprot:625802-Pleurochrysis_carterae.AAC.1
MQSPQVLDAGPRGASNLEAMSVLSTGKKGKGDDAGTSLGSHDVFGLDGKVVKDVGMVWPSLASSRHCSSTAFAASPPGSCLSILLVRLRSKPGTSASRCCSPQTLSARQCKHYGRPVRSTHGHLD